MKIKTKEDYISLINTIKNKVLLYENNAKYKNKYQIYLANGKRLNFEIKPQNIAHLLGIHLDYLRSTGLFKNKDAYDLLKEFLGRSSFVYNQVKDGHLAYDLMFSKYIYIKLDSFEKIIRYSNPEEIEFICCYDKSRTYQLGLEKDYPCDYFIAKKDLDGNIHILGLINKGAYCVPVSSMTFEKDENQALKLKDLLYNQVLTYPNGIIINNSITNYYESNNLTLETKIETLKTLRNYTTLIPGVATDVSKDYEFMMGTFLQKEQKMEEYKEKLQQLKDIILGRQSKNNKKENIMVSNNLNNVPDKEYSNLIKKHQLLCKKMAYLSKQSAIVNEQLMLYVNQFESSKSENQNNIVKKLRKLIHKGVK